MSCAWEVRNERQAIFLVVATVKLIHMLAGTATQFAQGTMSGWPPLIGDMEAKNMEVFYQASSELLK